MSALSRRENPAVLQQRLRRPSAWNPAVRVVVGVSPRHRRKWPLRLLRRSRQIRHWIPSGHPFRCQLQPEPMVGGGVGIAAETKAMHGLGQAGLTFWEICKWLRSLLL
ncbi:probable beta-d-xylosidase 6 [Phtheirospermum japonicum]|uniref:Probable beta-d-xylosidase 6 n=1 Tax=Phtheirospermum japonicum TaxID=374723 RepID=A0A830BUD8_9LAMI|nr:probable beta-d-xylosidase 6 [Phtheirospermum japonicum]